MAGGPSNRGLADHLVLGETTVKTHVSHVLSKLGLASRVQAVVLAHEAGAVRPGDAPPLVTPRDRWAGPRQRPGLRTGGRYGGDRPPDTRAGPVPSQVATPAPGRDRPRRSDAPDTLDPPGTYG